MPCRKSIQESGAVLAYVMMVLLLLSVLGMAVMSITLSNLSTIKAQEDFNQAFFVAETGAHEAYVAILPIVEKAYHEVLTELRQVDERVSSQALLQSEVRSKLPAKVQNALSSIDYFTSTGHMEIMEPVNGKEAKALVKASLNKGTTTQPLVITIKSIGQVGKVKRRVDMELTFNKVLKKYYNEIFQYGIFAEGAISIAEGGKMKVKGDVLVSPEKAYESNDRDKGIFINGTGTLEVEGNTYIGNNNIICFNGGSLHISGETICRTLEANGTGKGDIRIDGDIWVYNDIRAEGGNKAILLSGNTVGGVGTSLDNPEESSCLVADPLSSIEIPNGQFLIGGVVFYQDEDPTPIFGEYERTDGGTFQSPESLGGGNEQFYFTDLYEEFIIREIIPRYQHYDEAFIDRLFSIVPSILPDFSKERGLDDEQDGTLGKINALVQNRNYPPALPDPQEYENESDYDYAKVQYEGYNFQYGIFHDDRIRVNHFDENQSYARGAALINGTTRYPPSWKEKIDVMAAYFQEKRLEMDKKTDLLLSACINANTTVSNVNAKVTNGVLELGSPMKSSVLIHKSNTDITILGKDVVMNGILYAQGNVIIPPESRVMLNGILITRGEVNVQGELVVVADKGAIQSAIEAGGSTSGIASFFRQNMEGPFLENVTWEEVPIDWVN